MHAPSVVPASADTTAAARLPAGGAGGVRASAMKLPRRRRALFQSVAFAGLFATAVALTYAGGFASTASLDGHAPSPRSHLRVPSAYVASLFGTAPAQPVVSMATPSSSLHGRNLMASNTTCDKTGGDMTLVGAIAGQTCCDDGRGSCCSGLDMWAGVIFYFAVVLYTFLGLAIICDDYFCESLEAISEALNLSDDVAGATFMAAGSSAPELFTAVVTTLIIEGSEGLGTIVGSAIFNIMIIVGVTAICAGQALQIWWYPLSRDCVVYVISIVAMAVVVYDNEVQWYESMVLVICYAGYIALMVYNEQITDWIESRTSKVEPTEAAAAGNAATAAAAKLFSKLPSEKPVTDLDVSAAAKALAAAAQTGGVLHANPFAGHHGQHSMRSFKMFGSGPIGKGGDAPVAPMPGFGGSKTGITAPNGSSGSINGAGTGTGSGNKAMGLLSRPMSRHNQLTPLPKGSSDEKATPVAPMSPGSRSSKSDDALVSTTVTTVTAIDADAVTEVSPRPASIDATPTVGTAATVGTASASDVMAPLGTPGATPGASRPAFAAPTTTTTTTTANASANGANGASGASGAGGMATISAAIVTPGGTESPSTTVTIGSSPSAAASATGATAGAGAGAGARGAAAGLNAALRPKPKFGGVGGGGGGGMFGALAAAGRGGGSDGGSGSGNGNNEGSKKKKRGANPMLRAVNRHSANPDIEAKRRKQRAQLQVGTLLKVHSAKSILLRRLRARQAARAGSGTNLAAGAFGSSSSLVSRLAASAAAGADSKAAAPNAPAPKTAEASGGGDDDDDDGPKTVQDYIVFVLSQPYVFLFKYTVPDCREERWKKHYMLTFSMSIFWIGVLSFLMVDFAARAGCVMKVPGLVMGLVVIAAGTSVPDALSSILVAKNGQGDMAVANVLGSNVFNIFLGLGLPWFAKSCISSLDPIVLPSDEDIIVPVCILLLYVMVFVGVIAGNKWRLTKQLGYVFIFAHCLFVAWSLLTMLDDPVIRL